MAPGAHVIPLRDFRLRLHTDPLEEIFTSFENIENIFTSTAEESACAPLNGTPSFPPSAGNRPAFFVCLNL